ncbi:DNA repair protein XRCC1-like [Tubulanus polymorphus]|uniref:DNA repair protein XRCC1-like n=1 Tax=Tubulanus polymorphus TaxID=672921 RepID=UPI003DA5F9E0
MPEVKFQHVVSFSSEDKNNPAENLLKPGGFRKWKTAGVGEKNATVVLQFEKSTKIQSLDIGNESSAFIEILVGRSSATESDYKVLLVASAFMNPLESRSNQNLNRVRLFEKDKLTQSCLEEKWDRIKIVCSQPFNKNIQYGLSFITVRSPDDGTAAPSTSSAAGDGRTESKGNKTFGGFGLKKETEIENDPIKTGSLFAQRKDTKQTSLTGAAAVRAAAKLADDRLPVRKDDRPPAPNLERSSSERQTKYPSTTVVTPTSKRKHSSSSDSPEPKRLNSTPKSTTPKTTTPKTATPKTTMPKTSMGTSKTATPKTQVSQTKRQDSTSKRSSSETARKSSKPLGELMKRVVFVMSGYQNPKRGELRDMAIEMGAQYKPDWNDQTCTHLICAFVNTPKFAVVKGKGRIVDENWIRDCYKYKKLLPWRKYRLSRSGSPANKSAESSSEGEEPQQPAVISTPSPRDADDISDSAGDTEDEIKQLETNVGKGKGPSPKKGSPVKRSPAKKVKREIAYEASTDEDTDDDNATVTQPSADAGTDLNLPVLLDLFTGKHFLLYGTFSEIERRFLNRLIVAYNGHVEEYMNDSVNYVLTQEIWDKNFDKALSENGSLQFVNPEWIYKCDENQKLLPYQTHVITPVK